MLLSQLSHCALRSSVFLLLLSSRELPRDTLPPRPQTTLSKAQVFELFEQHEGTPFYTSMCEHMCSGPVIALALEKHDAVAAWLEMIG